MDASIQLPGKNCGGCGYPTCDEFAAYLKDHGKDIVRCTQRTMQTTSLLSRPPARSTIQLGGMKGNSNGPIVDRYGREARFRLEILPNTPGPIELVKLAGGLKQVREMEIKKGDILTGVPEGVSCGCPVTHMTEVEKVYPASGIIEWYVVGPLRSREVGTRKDIEFYEALAYIGLVTDPSWKPEIGVRYDFLPGTCMMQMRHNAVLSGAVRIEQGWRVKLSGPWIG